MRIYSARYNAIVAVVVVVIIIMSDSTKEDDVCPGSIKGLEVTQDPDFRFADLVAVWAGGFGISSRTIWH